MKHRQARKVLPGDLIRPRGSSNLYLVVGVRMSDLPDGAVAEAHCVHKGSVYTVVWPDVLFLTEHRLGPAERKDHTGHE